MTDTPSVVFLIPFAPRRVKSKWERACAHLRQTLKSIQNSTSGNYRVVVAGHEAPDFNIAFDSRFYFLAVNHPIPTNENQNVAGRLDKLAKISAAWNHAKSTWKPKYVMKLDADDFIISRLVGWLDTAGGEAGYLIQHGWLWRSGARYLIERTEYLDRVCGSCLVVRSDLADKEGPFLTSAEGAPCDEASAKFAASDQYSLIPGSGITTLLLNDNHQRYAAQFAYLGHKLSSVPFGAVVYRLGNSDSLHMTEWWDQRTQTLRMLLGRIRRTRLITKGLRRQFMLE
jgi:hypothetical protein